MISYFENILQQTSQSNRMKNVIKVLLLICFTGMTFESISQKAYMSERYFGTVGNKKIVMELVEGDTWFGDYYYEKYLTKISLRSDKLIGEEKNKVTINEYVDENKTGRFVFTDLDLTKKTLTAVWYNKDGSKSLPVTLNRVSTPANR